VNVREQALGGAHRVCHRYELYRIERAAQLRAPYRVADIACAAESARRAGAKEIPRGRGLFLKPLGLAEVGRRQERLGELSPRGERGALGDETTDRGELEPIECALVQDRDTPGEPRTYSRQGLVVVACSRSPMRTDRITRDGGTAGASWIESVDSTRSRLVCAVVNPKERASLPGPASARGARSSNPATGSAPRRRKAPAGQAARAPISRLCVDRARLADRHRCS